MWVVAIFAFSMWYDSLSFLFFSFLQFAFGYELDFAFDSAANVYPNVYDTGAEFGNSCLVHAWAPSGFLKWIISHVFCTTIYSFPNLTVKLRYQKRLWWKVKTFFLFGWFLSVFYVIFHTIQVDVILIPTSICLYSFSYICWLGWHCGQWESWPKQ